MLEKGLREKLRRVWVDTQSRASIHWVEPSMGSTFGMCDAFLVGGGLSGLLPCELKKGEMNNKGIAWEVRPAQGLYHRECYEYGVPTIFLCVVVERVYGTIGKAVIELPRRLEMRAWHLVEGPAQIRMLCGLARKALNA